MLRARQSMRMTLWFEINLHYGQRRKNRRRRKRGWRFFRYKSRMTSHYIKMEPSSAYPRPLRALHTVIIARRTVATMLPPTLGGCAEEKPVPFLLPRSDTCARHRIEWPRAGFHRQPLAQRIINGGFVVFYYCRPSSFSNLKCPLDFCAQPTQRFDRSHWKKLYRRRCNKRPKKLFRGPFLKLAAVKLCLNKRDGAIECSFPFLLREKKLKRVTKTTAAAALSSASFFFLFSFLFRWLIRPSDRIYNPATLARNTRRKKRERERDRLSFKRFSHSMHPECMASPPSKSPESWMTTTRG